MVKAQDDRKQQVIRPPGRLILRLIPKGINLTRKNLLHSKRFSLDLVEVAGVEPASEGV
jgi:hypothetical protein